MRRLRIEEGLDKAVARGVRQYVILGAALDSFAYTWRRSCRCLKWTTRPLSDGNGHACTTRIEDRAIAQPHFPSPRLRDANSHGRSACGGCRLEAPAFFSWLGVTMYLTEEAAFNTLYTVVALAPGERDCVQRCGR
ncbi:MAG TPA: class I SAM-dependent methyltransferase [Candidatus Binatia bacterium]|nr:class I SAM-dependent methyltransferase [Candidatus Binatia bacterium]